MSIIATLDDYLTTKEARKHHGGLSVTHVSNSCPRAVWNELHRGLKRGFTARDLKKMQYGFFLEDFVRAAMIAKGHKILDSKVVVFRPLGDPEILDAELFDKHPGAYAGKGDLVGHPDIVEVLDDGTVFVHEIKSTMLFRNGFGAPEHPEKNDLRTKSGQYVLQGVAYAKAFGAPKFGVYVSDRGTGVDREYVFDTDEEWPHFARRWETMKAALDPEHEPAPDRPPWTLNAKGQSYLCRGCPVTSCEFRLK